MTLFVHNDQTIEINSMYDRTNGVYVNDASLEGTLCELGSGNEGTITAASNATPIVVTSAGHGLSNGDVIVIAGVAGNYAANGVATVANATTDTFELSGVAGTGAFDSDNSASAKWYRAVTGAVSISLSYQSGSNGNYRGTIPGTASIGPGINYGLFIEDTGAYADKFTVFGGDVATFRSN